MTELEFSKPGAVKYNPAFLSEEDLVRRFVVRQIDLELLFEVVEDNTAPANQHVLVLGPRGSGKTTLLRRVAIAVERHTELGQRWFPVIFAEESYEVTSAGELWLEALRNLADQSDEHNLRRAHVELSDEPDEQRLHERCLAQLLDFADRRGARLMLVIENLDMLTEQLDDDDAWVLRHTLQTEPRIMVMASALTRFDQIEQSSKAFYELFKTHELERLSEAECGAVWQMVAGAKPPGSMRPIHILTGGNLRLLTIIAGFASSRSFHSLLVDLMHLVDEHTEYFKSHIDGLPVTERKVYLSLAKIWAPATARQVSEQARMDVSKTSVLLNRLVKRGAVLVNRTEGRRKFYELSERLYNVYYLMRRGGAPAQRVKAVVRFMLAYYGADTKKLVDVTAQLARSACEPDSPYRQEHIAAYAQLLEHPSLVPAREQILRATPQRFFLDDGVPDRVRELEARLSSSAGDYSEVGEAWLDLILPPGDTITRPLMRELWDPRTGQMLPPPQMLEISSRAVEARPTHPGVLARHAWILHLGEVGSFEEAEAALQLALEIAPDYIYLWYLRGGLHELAGRYEAAAKMLERVLERAPRWVFAVSSAARLELDHLQRYEAAEAMLRKAQVEGRDHPTLMGLLGLSLERQDRNAEALRAYQRSLELAPHLEWTRAQLAKLYEDLGRIDEAMESYTRLSELHPNDEWSRFHVARLLGLEVGRPAEGERVLVEFLDTHPESAWCWWLSGILKTKRSDYAGAVEAFQRALAIESNSEWWLDLFQALDELGALDEARAALMSYLKLNPEDAAAHAVLGTFELEQMENPEAAIASYRRALELDPEARDVWMLLGDVCAERLGETSQAIDAYRQVLRLAPGQPERGQAYLGLAQLGAEPWEWATDEATAALEHADAQSLNEAAWRTYSRAPVDTLRHALGWASRAVEVDPGESYYAHTLACVLARLGETEAALEAVQTYLADPRCIAKTAKDAVTLFVELAAHDAIAPALAALRASPSLPLLEALVIALEQEAGSTAPVPHELQQVAADIRVDIQRRREALQSG